MIRTQIQLTEDQSKVLKEIASERGVSIAELVRESVDRTIAERGRKDKWRRAIEIMGRHRSGLHDVSTNHDAYLDADFL